MLYNHLSALCMQNELIISHNKIQKCRSFWLQKYIQKYFSFLNKWTIIRWACILNKTFICIYSSLCVLCKIYQHQMNYTILWQTLICTNNIWTHQPGPYIRSFFDICATFVHPNTHTVYTLKRFPVAHVQWCAGESSCALQSFCAALPRTLRFNEISEERHVLCVCVCVCGAHGKKTKDQAITFMTHLCKEVDLIHSISSIFISFSLHSAILKTTRTGGSERNSLGFSVFTTCKVLFINMQIYQDKNNNVYEVLRHYTLIPSFCSQIEEAPGRIAS